MENDARVERTYQALMGVVQTTAVSRKVLARPPFTFLHKLLVETLAEYDLFSEHQLQFSAMTTKQAKAAFLTRAIAFVTFVMSAQSEHPHISCLLLVSPVQVLAGVSVPDTLEFLLQLCEVCRMPNRDVKEAAAQEVREKGDAQLYSSGVVFRKGLVRIQGIIRSFLRRRVRKAAPRLSGTPLLGRELSMTEGTRFLKELADGRIYNGIIQSVQKNIYVLGYEEDAEAQDKVNEIEMKIILEESQRLSAAREGHHQRTQEKQAMIRDIVMRIDSYMKRKRLRVIDLFRFCDADGNGSISPEEMIDTLSQMEIQLTPSQARDFLEHIDKDGNGSIDVDEFEELVRAARRNEAQREQLKKELNGPRKQPETKSSLKYNAVMKAKAKQTILDEFKAAQEEDGDGVNAHQLRAMIVRLALPGMNETFVSSIVDRAVEIATGSSVLPSTPLQMLTPPTSPFVQTRSSNSRSLISYHHLAKALDELEWTKKSNRFLDQSWIRQFDSQLERAIREYELL
ncbi:hypothetical protein PR002_g4524 [Phytophthora rubi]|uniref:EF-hand domain-containing protein n=1 Tax=Phytophthora rubi TaxID=129364 RepID=A0A6A3NLJ4_9STRA|nr:hypothetical protein PR002_g4524 [Phytophthora rubi]